MIKTRLIHTEAFRRDDDRTIVILLVVEYYVFPKDESLEYHVVEYRLIQETYHRGRELESQTDIRSSKWRTISEELCVKQRVYYRSPLFSKLILPSEIDRMTPVVERRFSKLVNTFNHVDPRMAIAFPESDFFRPILDMPYKPREMPDAEKTLCINNIGMEDRFEVGEFYPFRLSDDDKVLVVIDANGDEMECMASRFRI